MVKGNDVFFVSEYSFKWLFSRNWAVATVNKPQGTYA